MEALFCDFSQKIHCFFPGQEQYAQASHRNFHYFTQKEEHRPPEGQKPPQCAQSHHRQRQQPQPPRTGIEHETPKGDEHEQTEQRIPQMPQTKAAPQRAEHIIARRQTDAPQQRHAQLCRLQANGLLHQ